MLTAVIGFIFGLVTAPQFEGTLCGLTPWGNLTAKRFFCDDESLSLSGADAARTVDSFLEYASGTPPERAWYMLSTDYQGVVSRDMIAQGWADVLWAERLGDIHRVPRTFNTYTVRYRVFSGTNEDPDEQVNVYRQQFILRYSAGSPQVAGWRPQERLDTEELVAAPVRVDRATRSYAAPTRDATYGGDPTLGPGQLYALCKIAMPDGSWARTPIGWVSAEDLEGGDGGALASAPKCDAHQADYG